MYDLIRNLIDHSWVTTGANDQQYIYYVVSVLIIVLVVYFFDLLKNIFISIIRR